MIKMIKWNATIYCRLGRGVVLRLSLQQIHKYIHTQRAHTHTQYIMSTYHNMQRELNGYNEQTNHLKNIAHRKKISASRFCCEEIKMMQTATTTNNEYNGNKNIINEWKWSYVFCVGVATATATTFIYNLHVIFSFHIFVFIL